MTRKPWRDGAWAALFLGGAVFLMALFLIGPIIYSFVMSFTETVAAESGTALRFAGLEHYIDELTSAEFWESILNTVYFTVGVTVFGVILSLVVAVLLNQKLRGIKLFRNFFFMPVVLSTVVVALMWMQILGTHGLANSLLEALGLPVVNWLGDERGILPAVLDYGSFLPLVGPSLKGIARELPGWLGGPSVALTSIIGINIWRNIGYGMVLFLASLQTIPRSVYEAADIDGATAWSRFIHITVPLLAPTIFFLTLISIINSFQVFDLVYVLTGGAAQTNVAIFRVYNMFRNLDSPEIVFASTFLMFFILILIAVVQFRFERRVQYD